MYIHTYILYNMRISKWHNFTFFTSHSIELIQCCLSKFDLYSLDPLYRYEDTTVEKKRNDNAKDKRIV